MKSYVIAFQNANLTLPRSALDHNWNKFGSFRGYHIKFHIHLSISSGNADFNYFTVYGYDCHVSLVTKIVLTYFNSCESVHVLLNTDFN